MREVCGPTEPGEYKAVVIGGSAGGLKAFTSILAALPPDYALPVLLVQHLHPSDDGAFVRNLAAIATHLPVHEAGDKQPFEHGHVYVAPANYHMLMERNGTIALSLEERVNWSRPSIDVLFESAAWVLKERLIAVILTGASVDGSVGIRTVKTAGGLTLALDPATAEYPLMPQAAIDTGAVDEVLPLAQLGKRLVELGSRYVQKSSIS